MNCSDFEANIDRYLDGVLEADRCRIAVHHAGTCTTCNALVTSYQQAASLLKTAVADRAAAVDVSGLWEAIDAAVGNAVPTSAPVPVRSPLAPTPTPWSERWRQRFRNIKWLGERSPFSLGMAAAAAVAVALFFGADPGSDGMPQRTARAKSKAVRIEALEVPSGYTVSTWSRPRTRTHIISINQAPAYTLASATAGR